MSQYVKRNKGKAFGVHRPYDDPIDEKLIMVMMLAVDFQVAKKDFDQRFDIRLSVIGLENLQNNDDDDGDDIGFVSKRNKSTLCTLHSFTRKDIKFLQQPEFTQMELRFKKNKHYEPTFLHPSSFGNHLPAFHLHLPLFPSSDPIVIVHLVLPFNSTR